MKKAIYILLASVPLFFACSKKKEAAWSSPRREAMHWFEKQKEYPEGSREEQYYLQKSIDADPTYAAAWMEKSVAHNRRGEFAKGFELLNEAVRLAPLEYLGDRAYVKYTMLHDYEGALEDLVLLDSMTPDFTDAVWGKDIHHAIGIIHMQLGNYKKALASFDRSINGIVASRGEEWVDVKTFFYRGVVKMELNKYASSIRDFDKSIYYFEKFTEAHFYKGKVLLILNQPQSACHHFRKAKKYFEEGYLYKNYYYEAPHQVYMSDIDEALCGCKEVAER
ncbi:MAG TPA: hypothetical protein ENJ95_06350 [Bacteroidetes bacterium]|nr:hypothetical protein [Bacteroidota bacterium]